MEFGWNILKFLAIFSGAYILFDAVLYFAYWSAPNEEAFFGSQMDNVSKPMTKWFSEVVHSNTVLAVSCLIIGLWYAAWKKREETF